MIWDCLKISDPQILSLMIIVHLQMAQLDGFFPHFQRHIDILLQKFMGKHQAIP